MSAASPAVAAKPPASLFAKLARYLVVGGSAAVVDIGVFHLLAPSFDNIVAPAVASFVVAALYNFALLSLVVYRSNWRSARRAGKFLFFAVIGLCINASTTWLLSHYLGVPPTWAKVGGVGVAFIANFLMNTFIVFREEA
jgi:putative flippase GtrA